MDTQVESTVWAVASASKWRELQTTALPIWAYTAHSSHGASCGMDCSWFCSASVCERPCDIAPSWANSTAQTSKIRNIKDWDMARMIVDKCVGLNRGCGKVFRLCAQVPVYIFFDHNTFSPTRETIASIIDRQIVCVIRVTQLGKVHRHTGHTRGGQHQSVRVDVLQVHSRRCTRRIG